MRSLLRSKGRENKQKNETLTLLPRPCKLLKSCKLMEWVKQTYWSQRYQNGIKKFAHPYLYWKSCVCLSSCKSCMTWWNKLIVVKFSGPVQVRTSNFGARVSDQPASRASRFIYYFKELFNFFSRTDRHMPIHSYSARQIFMPFLIPFTSLCFYYSLCSWRMMRALMECWHDKKWTEC